MIEYTELTKEDIKTLIDRKSIIKENDTYIIRFYKRYIMYRDGNMMKNDELLIKFNESIVDECYVDSRKQINNKFISQLRTKTKD